MLNPLNSSLLPEAPQGSPSLRVATYNIHKGVRGMGPTKRLEIHNLSLAVDALDADLVCLQEVRHFNHQEARHFSPTNFGPLAWPQEGQADYLAPDGYEVAYRTNAITRHGEHGNALLSRWPMGAIGHHDVSDHRFEQRGLLHVPIIWHGQTLHVVVAHLGLIHASRVRQARQIVELVEREIPGNEPVIIAGDFNDWNERLDEILHGANLWRGTDPSGSHKATYPSRVPVLSLDRIYMRGMRCVSTMVPKGTAWARMSDHLPFVAELRLDQQA